MRLASTPVSLFFTMPSDGKVVHTVLRNVPSVDVLLSVSFFPVSIQCCHISLLLIDIGTNCYHSVFPHLNVFTLK